MKKIIVLLLALTLVFTLSACGNDAKPDEKGSESSVPESSSTSEVTGNNAAPAVETKDGFTALNPDKALRKSDMVITELKVGKEKYKSDEEIAVTVSWTGTFAEDAWIGVVPAETPHGDEEKNDEFDIDYKYFNELESGKEFVFSGLNLEPGKYTLRVNESDAGGAELAWCEFTVK